MKTLFFVILLASALAMQPAAAADVTVNGLVEIARDAFSTKIADKQLAKALSRLKVTERLDLAVVEELESEGAGPLAMEELERLMEESAKKEKPQAPLPFQLPPQPSLEEMRTVTQAARDYALNYARSLPDFLCTETVKRYEDSGPRGPRGIYLLKDTLTLHLSYSDQKEEYRLVALNNHPTNKSYEGINGASSEGEFGTMMYIVFDPRSRTHMFWDHWAHVHSRLVQVYSYVIKLEDSAYTLTFGGSFADSSARAGAQGLVYIDPETHAILRLRRAATDLPANFPISLATTVLDYDYGEVGGRRFFLPTRATIRLDTKLIRTRNEVEFSEYRKFAGESTISFGDPAPPPIKH